MISKAEENGRFYKWQRNMENISGDNRKHFAYCTLSSFSKSFIDVAVTPRVKRIYAKALPKWS